MTQLRTSETGYSLIKAFEGFRAQAAPLENGGWVIGYGHTASARKGVRLSRADAADLLRWDVRNLEGPLQSLIYAPLNQNQFDALISLVFNIGLEHFKSSAVLRYLNEGCPVNAAAAFDAWRCARLAGRVIVVDALVRRRAAEKALFLASPGTNVVAPTPQVPPLCDPQICKACDEATPLEVTVDMQGQGDIHIADEAGAGDASSHDETAAYVSLDEAFGAGEEAPEAAREPQHPVEDDSAAGTSGDNGGKDDDDDNNDDGDSPVAAAAEKIIAHLDSLAADDEASLQDNPHEAPADTEAAHGDEASVHAVPVAEEAAPQETPLEMPADIPPVEAPPVIEEEHGGLTWEMDETPEEPAEEDLAAKTSAFGPEDLDFFNTEDTGPEVLHADAPVIRDDQDFHPGRERGWVAFTIMGIIGIGMVLSGLWQLQMRGGTVSDTQDLVMGPGQAALGVLVVAVSAYALLRRLGTDTASA